MFNSIRILTSIALALSMTACASINPKSSVPIGISHAPAIDTPYAEVSKDIKANIGVNVRWGGEIISSKKVGDITELTVLAHPLSKDGRPIPWSDKDFNNGRFIVKVKEHQSKLIRTHVTVYGQVSGEKTLVNGPKTKTIPVVTAIESREWQPEVSNDKRGIAYYSLGHRTGHFNSFGKFGNRGFSRFGRSYYGHGFHSRSRFGIRRSFGRRGFH